MIITQPKSIPIYIRVFKNRINVLRCDDKPIAIYKTAAKAFSNDQSLLHSVENAIELLVEIRKQLLMADPTAHTFNAVIQAYNLRSEKELELDEIDLHHLSQNSGFKNTAVWLGHKLEPNDVQELLMNFNNQ